MISKVQIQGCHIDYIYTVKYGVLVENIFIIMFLYHNEFICVYSLYFGLLGKQNEIEVCEMEKKI